MHRCCLTVGILFLGLSSSSVRADDAALREQAARSLRKAVEYYGYALQVRPDHPKARANQERAAGKLGQ